MGYREVVHPSALVQYATIIPSMAGPTKDVSISKSPAKRYAGFDAIRIVAALFVVFTHSFELTGHGADRPIIDIGKYQVAFGELGVAIFFITSGFLVAQSWERTGQLSRFARHRFVRIWPALLVLVALSAGVLGPAITTLSLKAYAKSHLTWKYVGKNATLLFGAAFRLPGVFLHQPVQAVNGSLWTLPHEIYSYIVLAILGVTGLLRRWFVPVVVFLALLLAFRVGVLERHMTFHLPGLSFLELAQFVRVGAWFFAGASCAVLRDRIRLQSLALPGVIGVVVAAIIGEPVLFYFGLTALTIGVGALGLAPLAALHRFGDPSYGIYIFSFPIQQLLVRQSIAKSSLVMFAVSAPLSIAVGYLSWHLVEHRALRRFKDPRPPAPAPAPVPGSAPGAR